MILQYCLLSLIFVFFALVGVLGAPTKKERVYAGLTFGLILLVWSMIPWIM